MPSFTRRAAAGSVALGLRSSSLAGKLALSLYMGKFFPLAELGRYGLAFGAVMIAIVLFGFRVDYILAREALGMEKEQRRRAGTSVATLYLGSFVLVALLASAVLLVFGGTINLPFLLLIYFLCGIEAYSNFLYTLTIALKRPELANALFFVRSGLWTIPAIAVGYLNPAFRNVEFVLVCWSVGAGSSVLLNLWFMRTDLIGRIRNFSASFNELQIIIKSALLVWLGSVAVTLGGYADRFILAKFLTLEDVGVATFYLSFTTAALALVQSATTSVTFPLLIEHYDKGHLDAFKRELRRTALVAGGLCFLILVGLAVAMRVLGDVLGRMEFLANYPTFLLLLVATLVKTHAETLYYGLFVERQHRAIWLGNLLFLMASLLLNLLLVPIFGLVGLGIAAILAAAVILVWRSKAIKIGPFI